MLLQKIAKVIQDQNQARINRSLAKVLLETSPSFKSLLDDHLKNRILTTCDAYLQEREYRKRKERAQIAWDYHAMKGASLKELKRIYAIEMNGMQNPDFLRVFRTYPEFKYATIDDIANGRAYDASRMFNINSMHISDSFRPLSWLNWVGQDTRRMGSFDAAYNYYFRRMLENKDYMTCFKLSVTPEQYSRYLHRK